jgi:hypothetical protein
MNHIHLTAAVAVAALGLSTAADAQVILTFQEGVDGYASTTDAEIRSSDPDVNSGGQGSISVDGDDGSPGAQPNQGLIRFGDIVGTGAGQIAPGSPIGSATLTLNVFNPGSGFTVHQLLTAFDENTVTWNNYGSLDDGILPGTDAIATPLDTVGANDFNENVPTGSLVLDVTAAVQAFADGADNFGFGLVPFADGGNGIDFDTSESTFGGPALRPLLTVSVIPEPASLSLLSVAGLAALRRRRA